MSLGQNYQQAVRQALAPEGDPSLLLPMALVRACVQVLPIDGAGLSLTHELRVPLSASSEVVARAERLQVTLGEGPCLSASALRSPLVADLETLAGRWPVFHTELVRQTPFRSIASLPIRLPDGPPLGAVDLYSQDASAAPFAVIPQVGMEVADQVAAFLLGTSTWLREGHEPGTGDPEVAADRRLNVWVAVGMVMAHTGLSNLDALALLRAYAFGQGLDLDDLAEQVTTEVLPVPTLVRSARRSPS